MSDFPAALIPRILFEDVHLIVIDKPAGLLSQGEHTGDFNLVDWLRNYWGRPYVGLVHRLDRNTSGVLVVGKRTKAAQRLTEALIKGELRRNYLAWLCGKLPLEARWSHFLLKDEVKNIVRAVKAGTSGAKSAALQVKPKGNAHRGDLQLTLVEFTLETGRSHQIRAQAAAEGFPLLGDLKYLGHRASPNARDFPRPALHSWHIEFPHPMSGEKINFTALIPADFRAIAPGLNWDDLDRLSRL